MCKRTPMLLKDPQVPKKNLKVSEDNRHYIECWAGALEAKQNITLLTGEAQDELWHIDELGPIETMNVSTQTYQRAYIRMVKMVDHYTPRSL